MGVGRTGLRPAVFLDRDGVLNEAVVRDGRPYPPETLADLRIVADAPEAVRSLKAAGFVLVVVTNQPDVARGTRSRAEVDRMNERVRAELGLDAVYVCAHDDVDDCDCRKPRPGLVLRAARELELDLTRSYLIGDRWRDVACGEAAGVRTVFVDRDYAERRPDPPADATVRTTAGAARHVLESREQDLAGSAFV